jgi:RND family efflux transporter MFP subunit
MSPVKQILLSVLVLVILGGGWWAFQHRALWLGSGLQASSDSPAGAAPDGATRRPGAGPGAGAGPGNRRPGGGGNAAVPVVAGQVTIDSTGDQVSAIGTLAANRAVDIYPQVTGIVSEVDFTPGGKVKAGQTLIKLDDSDQKVAVDRAKIALDDANAALDRSQKLAQTNAITNVALSTARTIAAKAEIDLQSAQLDLAKRTITAPFDGVVGLSDISVGVLATTSKSVTTLDDISTLTVEFQAPERFAGAIAIGKEIAATADALPGQTFKGKIVAIDSRIDPATRQLKMKASLPNDSGVLKPGMGVTVAFDIPGEPHPAVPSLSVQWDRQGSFVWKLDGDSVSRVGVAIVSRHGQSVIVMADLKDGDTVVTEGVQSLRPGSKVLRSDDGEAASASPGPGAGPATPGKPADETAKVGAGATKSGGKKS